MPTCEAAVPTFTFRELTIWRTKLPHVEHAAMPPSNMRPNPLVADDKLFVSVSSPGAVCTLDRNSGKLLWRRELSDLGRASAYLYNRRLFVNSWHTLYALLPENGKVLWAFCPYGTKHETMYSSPTGYQGRTYIGDRKGLLRCLDAATGQTLWNFRTSRAQDCAVNSTPLIASGSVMVTTNAKSAIACDPATGRLNWKQRLDALSAFGPMSWRGLLVARARSVYFLDPHSGGIRRCLKLRSDSPQFVECTPDSVIVAVKGEPRCGRTDRGGRLTLLQPVLPAKLPNRHPAPRCFSNRPLPETCLFSVAFATAHPTPPPSVHTCALRAYICQKVSGGSFSRERWVHRTDSAPAKLARDSR